MVTTIIFDLDDTLYNENTYVVGAFRTVCEYLSSKYDLDNKGLYKDIIEIFNNYGRGKIFNILCEKYTLDENINNLVKIYRNSKPELKLYNDALEILNWLNQKKYNIGLVTDGDSTVQYNKIKFLNIDKFIEKIVVSDDFGKDYWKPHEKPYLEVINYFNVKPSQCIYVGDNPNKDFLGAKKLGLTTIRIIREEGDHMKTFLSKEFEADFNIENLAEIKQILTNLEGEDNE